MDKYLAISSNKYIDKNIKLPKLRTEVIHSNIKFNINCNQYDDNLQNVSIKLNVALIDIEYINNKKIHAVYYCRMNEYYQKGYCIAKDNNDNFYLLMNNIAICTEITRYPAMRNLKVYLISKTHLFQLLDQSFKIYNVFCAKYYLELSVDYHTARSISYNKRIGGFIIIFILCFFFYPVFFSFTNSVFYCLQNILKLSLVYSALSNQSLLMVSLYQDLIFYDLPYYTIMVPLYKEVKTLKSILQAMDKICYHKERLDIKFIIEEDDWTMVRALLLINIPNYIHIIKVPKSFPRTKPKALNYAMRYIKGQYLVIYDAEDVPDPNQLLKALAAFDSLPSEYVCMQARLNFYNAEYNLLTRFFSIEYFLWFNYLIKGLAYLKLPTPLGGTSNHFRVNIIKELGFWDAYNVTEDADFGLRIYLNQYKTYLIDSTTFEEAPTTLDNWLYQRARWIKGFIQTFFVFLDIKKNYSLKNIINSIIAYILVGLGPYNFFVLPWLILKIGTSISNSYLVIIMIINCLLIFIYSYCSTVCMLYDIKNMSSFPLKCSLFNVVISLVYPIYWILHVIASYRAILELCITPFKWNKTEHGIDKDSEQNT